MTDDTTTIEPRDRIVRAAITLFSRQGFSATGVREIAREADVNVAMISYYFGSKKGVLLAIFDDFFGKVTETVRESLLDISDPELAVRKYLRTMITIFKDDPELARVAILELPYDHPDLASHKADKLREFIPFVAGHIIPVISAMANKPVKIEVVGPAMMAIIFMHFTMRPVLERVFPDQFDEAFYESYADEVADLLFFGVLGKKPQPTTDTSR